ncbi:S1 RNA-binding domain-containing protein [uncultured Dokdonia sp.]|uniref:S1 RNA-binding domain-containing protein n=1 Tax=uncultured Dokdonia sp. TaxID=575653 RepID=UPI00263763AD|nr:S1 RNA-binding domain-containing protein [uncultured Dokdonia sp.]
MNKNEFTWKELTERLQIGQEITGVVFQQEAYGVYVDIGEAFYGIVLTPQISLNNRITLEEFPKIGDTITSVILGFSEHTKEESLEWNYVSLSIKKYLLKSE